MMSPRTRTLPALAMRATSTIVASVPAAQVDPSAPAPASTMLAPPSPAAGSSTNPTENPAAPAPPSIDSGLEVALPDGRVRLVLEDGPRETGLPVVFRIEVVGRSDAPPLAERVELPSPGAMLGDFEVITPPATPATASTPNRPTTRLWAVRTFGSGTVVLPAFPVILDGARIETEPRSIEIRSVAGLDTDPAAFRDISDAIEVTSTGTSSWWWLAGVATLLAATLAFWWWRRRKAVPTPPLPADQWALARLDALLAEGLVERGRVQAFFFRLTDVARAFIERRYDLAAPDRTTTEFIDEARRHPEMGEEVARLLGNLLKAADMVKFAGDRPAETECTRAAETIRRFIVESGPRPDVLDDRPERTSRVDVRDDAVTRAVDDLDRLEARS